MSESETVWARGGKRFQLLWIPVIVQNSNPLAFLSLFFLLSVFTVLPFVHDKLHTLAQCMRNKHTFFLFSSAEKEYSSLHEDENEFSILISLHHRAHSRARKLPEMSCHIHGKLNFEFHSHRVCTHFPFTRFVYISVFQFIIRHRTIHSHTLWAVYLFKHFLCSLPCVHKFLVVDDSKEFAGPRADEIENSYTTNYFLCHFLADERVLRSKLGFHSAHRLSFLAFFFLCKILFRVITFTNEELEDFLSFHFFFTSSFSLIIAYDMIIIVMDDILNWI